MAVIIPTVVARTYSLDERILEKEIASLHYVHKAVYKALQSLGKLSAYHAQYNELIQGRVPYKEDAPSYPSHNL